MRGKIAISCRGLGGLGGQQRNIFTTIKSLEDHQIDVYTKKIIPSEFFPLSNNVNIYLPKFTWGKTCLYFNPLKRYKGFKYDIYIHYYGGVFLGNRIACNKSLLIPSGHDVRKIERKFHYVLGQSPDGIKYIGDTRKHVVIPPPVMETSSKSEKIEVPKSYFLTVFNPYDYDIVHDDILKPCKGYDELYALADYLPFPLVWCHSERTISCSHNIHQHRNILHLDDIRQSELRYLYENTVAYICFSRQEGFGWSVADAILYQKPIISRNIGLLQLYKPQKGLYFYKSFEELLKLVKMARYDQPQYDRFCISPEQFRNKIYDLP